MHNLTFYRPNRNKFINLTYNTKFVSTLLEPLLIFRIQNNDSEIAYSNVRANYEYCIKGGVYIEFGSRSQAQALEQQEP
jgi:hypothetical protein